MAYTPTVYSNGVAPPINGTNLNHLENGLQTAAAVADAALVAPTPVTNGPVYWNGSAWVSAKLADAQIAAAAGIAYSKLNLATSIVNADVAAAAAITLSKLAGYPSDATKFARGDGTWAVPSGATTYRKTTAKAVNTTTSATDLLNAEITVAAGAMGATGVLRVKCWGDYLNNSGGAVAQPRFQLIFGGTTFFDSGATAGAVVADATRRPWDIDVLIQNATASSQTATFVARLIANVSGGLFNAFTTGAGMWGEGVAGTTTPATGQAVNAGLTVATGSAATLVLNVINGSANAAYETKLFGALVEVL